LSSSILRIIAFCFKKKKKKNDDKCGWVELEMKNQRLGAAPERGVFQMVMTDEFTQWVGFA
jgi:hypothetical protein